LASPGVGERRHHRHRRSEPSAVPALTFAAVEVEEEPATTGEDREVGSPRRRKATSRSSTISGAGTECAWKARPMPAW
jgi:hypothetical protein